MRISRSFLVLLSALSLGTASRVSSQEPLAEAAQLASELADLGQTERLRAAELASARPPALSVESLELSHLELQLGRYRDLVERLEGQVPVQVRSEGARVPRLENALLLSLATALEESGELGKAEILLAHLAGQWDDLTARAELGLLLEGTGRWSGAEDLYDQLIDDYNQSSLLGVEQLMAVGIACRQLGKQDPQLFKDALKAFDQAIEAARGGRRGWPARVALANLFVDKYDSPQARQTLAPVLEGGSSDPRALVTLAKIERFEGNPEARSSVERALAVNPNSVDALVLLASLENEVEDHDAASRAVERALAVNPRSLGALTVLAGLRFLDGDQKGFEEARAKVFAIDPNDASFYVELSLLAMRNRLYTAAHDFARSAVDLDPRSWQGWGELGLNQLRLGRIEGGRDSLETSFRGDPYNVWVKNTLDLLDRLTEFTTVKTEHFLLVLHRDEADLLAPLVGDLAERAFASLAERYRYLPATPIRIEVYPSHEDFSVRTVGLSGIGALGVSFGPVIAIDSPAARGIGDFNWGTTLWHEIAHTFTLGLSAGKVPRWLTEGLSVYEERQGPEGWMDDPTPEFLAAYAEGRLLGLRAMNDGFVRPSFANQIGLSYFQASLIAELIERDWDFSKIVAMLADYADGLDTEKVFQRQLSSSLEDFDRRFWTYLDQRFVATLPTFRRDQRAGASPGVAPSVEPERKQEDDLDESPQAIAMPTAASGTAQSRAEARPDDYRAQLAYGAELLDRGDLGDAASRLEIARNLFPDFAGPGSAYHLLAEVARRQHDSEALARALRQLVDVNEYDFDAHLELAELYRTLERPKDELEILERTLYIYPYEPRVHERMADLALGLGLDDLRIRSLRSVLAVRPTSRPRTYYELATTYRRLGRLHEAKVSVLSSLELAPSYQPAQDLLLELVDAEAAGQDS